MLNRIKNFAYAFRSALSTLSNPQRWFVEMFGGSESKAGARVNEDTAVKVTAVFACIRLLAQTLASLPLHTYRRIDDGKERAYNHSLYTVLHDLANPECTSYNFRLIMMVNLLLTGNAYAEKVHNKAGDVIALWPIPSNRVAIKRNKKLNIPLYEVYTDNGKTIIMYPEKMFHIQWVGMANLRSFKPVELAREAIGLSIAAEEFGSRFFSNGANASGIAEYPGRMSDESYERFKKTFNEKYTGLSKGQRVMFLEEGLKFTKLTINPNEAQAIETRKFQVIEVCRFYNVPPHLIMDLERSTFSNIEHQDISFVKYSLRPYLVCWEQEMLRSLFLPSERRTYFSEFNVDGLLRGDAKSRAEALDIQMRNGVINADEWRAMENMNPQPDGLGQIFYVPLNWVPKQDSLQQDKDPPDKGDKDKDNDDDNDDNDDKDDRQSKQQLEKRAAQKRSAKAKAKAATNYKRLFRDAAQRIVNREKSQILDKAQKTLTERSQFEFTAWLERYYEDAPEWMRKTLKPALMSYTETIQELAAQEVGADVGLTPELEKWMDGYLDIWARDYTSESLLQLQALIRKANEEALDALAEVEKRLDEWEERRPGKVALTETITAAGVISKFVYAAAGIRYIRWEAVGDDPCPYCLQLHGRVVGIDQPFLSPGDTLDAGDAGGETLNINQPRLTPPLHKGCVCQLVAN